MDLLVFFPIKAFLNHPLHDGNSCETTDKNNIMNIALVNPAATETLLHGIHGTSEIFHVRLLESCFRLRVREINAVEKGVDLNGHLRKGRQAAFGAFILCPETADSSMTSSQILAAVGLLIIRNTFKSDADPASLIVWRFTLTTVKSSSSSGSIFFSSRTPVVVFFNDCHQRVHHCKRVAATTAAVPAAAAVVVGAVGIVAVVIAVLALLSFLPVVPCSHFSLSPPATRSVSRVSRATLVAARHTLRQPRVVRRCGPLSIRTQQASLHHVMCLFDTPVCGTRVNSKEHCCSSHVGNDHHVDHSFHSVEDEAGENHEFHRQWVFPYWTLTSTLAGKNWWIGRLIIFFVVSHGSFWRLHRNPIVLSSGPFVLMCEWSELPIIFTPLQLIARCDVRVNLTLDLVKTSANIFVPSDDLLRFSVRIVLLEQLEDWSICVLGYFLQTILRLTILALCSNFFFPWRASWRVPFFMAHYGMVSASNLSLVNCLEYSIEINHVPEIQLNWRYQNFWFWNRSRTTRRAPSFAKIMNHLLCCHTQRIMRAIFLQIDDYCVFVCMILESILIG